MFEYFKFVGVSSFILSTLKLNFPCKFLQIKLGERGTSLETVHWDCLPEDRTRIREDVTQ